MRTRTLPTGTYDAGSRPRRTSPLACQTRADNAAHDDSGHTGNPAARSSPIRAHHARGHPPTSIVGRCICTEFAERWLRGRLSDAMVPTASGCGRSPTRPMRCAMAGAADVPQTVDARALALRTRRVGIEQWPRDGNRRLVVLVDHGCLLVRRRLRRPVPSSSWTHPSSQLLSTVAGPGLRRVEHPVPPLEPKAPHVRPSITSVEYRRNVNSSNAVRRRRVNAPVRAHSRDIACTAGGWVSRRL